MVAVERGLAECQHCFVLRPNRSLSWRQNQLVFASFCVVTLLVVLPLVAMGFWLVLPFAGLELLAVGAALYAVTCRCHECEVICIAEDTIRIEQGRRYPQRHWILARPWARVVLEGCPRRWYPSRLLIRTHGRAVEVGRFLPEDERQRLARQLTGHLGAVS